MDLPSSLIVSSSLVVGRVYKFSAPDLLNTNVPHFFIVVAIMGEDNYALVSTTQLQKRIDFVNSRGISLETICYIEPTDENELTKDSYIDCNKYFEIPNVYLEKKVMEGGFEVKGVISDEDFEKLRASIGHSPLFDLPLDYIQK